MRLTYVGPLIGFVVVTGVAPRMRTVAGTPFGAAIRTYNVAVRPAAGVVPFAALAFAGSESTTSATTTNPQHEPIRMKPSIDPSNRKLEPRRERHGHTSTPRIPA